MTRAELISQIKNELKINNADNRLTNRFIWSIINKHMKWLVKRESTNLRLIRQNNIFQTKKCVHVEEAPTIDPCCGIRSKCTVYRTCEKLPELFEDDYGVIIKNVLVIDNSNEFSLITLSEYIRKLENPHSKYDKNLYYFYNDGHLYFPKSTIRMVSINGYFIDDVKNDCDEQDDTECTPFMEMEARIPEYLLGELMNQVLSELLNLTKIQSEDQIDKAENRKA